MHVVRTPFKLSQEFGSGDHVLRDIISREALGQYDPIQAVTYHSRWHTASQPALITASDSVKYVVKGSQNARSLFSEYVCCRLGHLLGAPTVHLRFVDVQNLRSIEPQMAHFGTALALGSKYLDGNSNRIDAVQHIDHGDNRGRFARLALLYAWAKGGDCQFLYDSVPPCLVYSNDHGHFFPGSTAWTAATLQADGDVAKFGQFDICNFTVSDFAAPKMALATITDDDVRKLVAAPPNDWGVPADDRTAMANYLICRRAAVLALYQ